MSKRRQRRGVCAKCRKFRPMTSHHIIPRRLRLGDRRTVEICEPCHIEIEETLSILERRILQKYTHVYEGVVKPFLQEGP